MLKSTPIVVVDDDVDEHETMQHIFDQLGIRSAVIYFDNTSDAWNYLSTTTDAPFIIICDINLPKQDGLEFKKKIDAHPELRRKSIPFIFYSTAARQSAIDIAYSTLSIQGVFEKPNDTEEMKNLIKLIMEYWYRCKHPNSFKQQTSVHR